MYQKSNKIKNLTNIRINCSLSDCYPPSQDILFGRSRFLFASSTCGLNKPEHFCILNKKINNQEYSKRCYTCDSKSRFKNKSNHRIEKIVKSNPIIRYDQKINGELAAKWWQSESGKENVYIQFDLEAHMTITHLMIKFKSLPPAAMLIEMSNNFGVSWKVKAYYAYDCKESFPNILTINLKDFNKPFCTNKFSGIESTSGAELYYAPLLQLKNRNIDRTKLQDILKLTNIRFNFTKLHMLDHMPQNHYYGVSEIKIIGSCVCNGHSSECIKASRIQYDLVYLNQMMHSKCKCEHNTDGFNCEKCLPLYNDRPWKQASNLNKNECKKCECNSHAIQCTFDELLFINSNGTSGGRCNCLHNTIGINCEKCKNGYYRNLSLPYEDPNVCVKCNCNSDNTLACAGNFCQCKQNFEGIYCEKCKKGYWKSKHGCLSNIFS